MKVFVVVFLVFGGKNHADDIKVFVVVFLFFGGKSHADVWLPLPF